MEAYYIAIDMEGVACVVGTPGEGLSSSSANRDFAAREALREANAAARALGKLRLRFSRGDCYLGVMVDDLSRKGVEEP